MKSEIPLNPYDSCRLLAINLYSYVEKPFTPDSYFNTGKFFKHVIYAQRLMDDLVDLEIEKLDKIIDKIKSDPEPYSIKEVELELWVNIRDKAIRGRRTGLGITGEGDMLAALGLRYGTTEATEQSESVHKNMAIQSYISSIVMASERGSFTVWDKDKDLQSNFIYRIIGKLPNTIKTIWNTAGRRNIGNLTIAPTGTVSKFAA